MKYGPLICACVGKTIYKHFALDVKLSTCMLFERHPRAHSRPTMSHPRPQCLCSRAARPPAAANIHSDQTQTAQERHGPTKAHNWCRQMHNDRNEHVPNEVRWRSQ